MNQLQKKQAEFQALLKEFDAISTKDSPTPEDAAKCAELLETMKGVKAEIVVLGEAADLKTWSQSMSPDDQKGMARLIAGTDPEAGGRSLDFGGKKETVVFEVGQAENGNVTIKVADGFVMELSEKQARAIMEPGYKSAWLKYVIRGKRISDIDLKTITEGEDTEGGYLVPPDILREILRRDPHPTEIVDMVRRVPVGSDVLKLPRNYWTTDDIYPNPYRIEWAGERADPAASTDITWGEWKCDVHEGYMKVPITRSMLEDSSIPIEDYVAEEMRSAYRVDLEKYIVSSSGNGVSKPYGILFNPGGTNEPATVNIGNAVTADGLKDLANSLPPQYDKNRVFVMNKTNVYATLSKLTKTDMGYVFGSLGQGDNNLAGAPIDKLLGSPIVFSGHMPNGGAGNAVVIGGDLRKGYMMPERVAMSIRVEDLPSKAFVQVVARVRVGGQVFQDRALKVGIQT